MELTRRLYPRGGSYETTIPKPLLFAIDPAKRHDVRFAYDRDRGKWYIEIRERDAPARSRGSAGIRERGGGA